MEKENGPVNQVHNNFGRVTWDLFPGGKNENLDDTAHPKIVTVFKRLFHHKISRNPSLNPKPQSQPYVSKILPLLSTKNTRIY